MFYIKENDKIVLFDEDRQKLQETLAFTPQYAGAEILETAGNETIVDFEIVTMEQASANELQQAKEAKKEEASTLAYKYLASGEALYELAPDENIEATDGNIGKLTAYALGFVTGVYKPDDTIEWTTKEDVKIKLSQERIQQVLVGLGAVQSNVWNIQFPAYIAQIDSAETVEEVKQVVMDYKTNIYSEV